MLLIFNQGWLLCLALENIVDFGIFSFKNIFILAKTGKKNFVLIHIYLYIYTVYKYMYLYIYERFNAVKVKY